MARLRSPTTLLHRRLARPGGRDEASRQQQDPRDVPGTVGSPAGPLAGLVEALPDLLLVLGPSVASEEVDGLLPHPRRTDLRLDEEDPAASPHGPSAVVLVLRDRLELRQVVAACRSLPAAAQLCCVLLSGGPPLLTSSRPDWPALVTLTAESAPVCFTWVQLEAPLLAGALAADLARRSTPSHLMSPRWPVLALERATPQTWPPGDALSFVGTGPAPADVTGHYPADVVVTRPGAPEQLSGAAHHLLERGSATLQVEAPPSWSRYRQDGEHLWDERLAAASGLSLPPVDSALINPQGFLRRTPQRVSTLAASSGSPLLRIDTDDGPVVLDSRQGLRDADVPRLRRLRAVTCPWTGAVGPVEYCRIVVGLAMAGVPLRCGPVPSWASALIHPALLSALCDDVDLDDPLLREVWSIRARRAAFAHHGDDAWRRSLVSVTGSAAPTLPRVSVLLATRRPEKLAFALRQVVRQRGVQLEVVLATHGHEPDQRVVDEALGTSPLRLTCVVGSPDDSFGTLLNAAAARAGGDVLVKMDDDDWYGPDFIADLLMARRYSGADVTGALAEFVYVEPLDLTVRRRDATESYRPVVAGGTLMLSRDTFEAVGGFRRMRRHVDAGLLAAVAAAGGSIYRTHGHDYLLHRDATGHTWDPGLPYFVSRYRTWQQWPGFQPSPLLEVDDRDRPVPGGPP